MMVGVVPLSKIGFEALLAVEYRNSAIVGIIATGGPPRLSVGR